MRGYSILKILLLSIAFSSTLAAPDCRPFVQALAREKEERVERLKETILQERKKCAHELTILGYRGEVCDRLEEFVARFESDSRQVP